MTKNVVSVALLLGLMNAAATLGRSSNTVNLDTAIACNPDILPFLPER